MNFLKFFIDKIFIRNIIYAIIITFIAIWLTFLFLKIYTRHGRSRPVPDFKGLKIDEAQKLCKKNRLNFNIKDSVFLTNKPKGTIIEQNPLPGSRVKKRRNVFMIINALSEEIVQVPNVVGVSFRQAKYLLESNGLTIGKLEYVRDLAVNNVLNQKYDDTRIIPGSELSKYAEIDLVLGNGKGNKRTYVPHLFTIKNDEVKEILLNSYCNLGTIIYDNTINSYSDSLKAFVWKQFPEYDENRSVKLGTYVDIWVTRDIEKITVNDSLINE